VNGQRRSHTMREKRNDNKLEIAVDLHWGEKKKRMLSSQTQLDENSDKSYVESIHNERPQLKREGVWRVFSRGGVLWG